MIQSFLGGDQNTQSTARGSVAFQDGISSAKQQDGEVDADTQAGIPTNGTIPQTDYSISVLTEGKVTASPGTQEYKNQMNAHITETLQSNLGKFTYFSNAPFAAQSELTNDQLQSLTTFFGPQQPEDKAINGDQNTVGTQAFETSAALTIMAMAESADEIQGKIGSDNFRALLKDPSDQNLSQYPQLTDADKVRIQDPTFGAVVSALDVTASKTSSDAVNDHETLTQIQNLDVGNPKLSSPIIDTSNATAFAEGLTPPGGNPFFSVALTSVLAVMFTQLGEIQSRTMLLESMNLIASMNRTGALYASAADMIEKSAQAQATMYMVQAAMSAVQFVGTGVALGGMLSSRSQAEKDVDKDIAVKEEAQTTATKNLNDFNARLTPETNSNLAARDELKTKDPAKMTEAEKTQLSNLNKQDEIKQSDALTAEKSKADRELYDAKANKVHNIQTRTEAIFWSRQMMSQMIEAGTKAIEGTSNAIMTTIKGQLDAALKLNEGATKINEQSLQSANKAMNDARDAFRAVMEAKERSIGAMMKAMSINTRG